MTRLLILGFAVPLVACATAQPPQPIAAPQRPMVASLEPIATPPLPPIGSLAPAAAGALLEHGMYRFKKGEFEAAAAAFVQAVETDRLNNAGRALAYWHVFVSQQQLGDVDASAEALIGFVVVAEDVLEVRDMMQYAVNEAGDFVDRFELRNKLRHARAVLSATWAGREGHFGRSADRPVPVHDTEEVQEFLEIIAPCDAAALGGRDDQSSRQVTNSVGELIHRVSVTCGSLGDTVDYFFDVPAL